VDYSKAFDVVSQQSHLQAVVESLMTCSSGSAALYSVEQRTKIGSTISDQLSLSSGVVQGNSNSKSNSNDTMSMLPPIQRPVAHYNVNVRINN